MYGLSDGEIADLLNDRVDNFSAAERALIRLSDTMTATPVQIDDALYAEVKSHFSEEDLIELGADIAQENYRARWNRLLDIASDELYCPI